MGFRAEQSDLSAALSVLADIPGRDPEPREIPSPYLQMIRLAPIAGASIGSKADGKWDGPALLLGYGEKGPVRFAWHGPGEDNGNTAIVGQSGSGKSALLAKLVSATLKYEGARVVVFDVGRAFMPTCLCLGGDWRELGRGTACVQPLRHIDVPEQAILIHDWLSRAIQHQGVRRTHETDHAIHGAMRLVARQPLEKRTMSGLVARLGASTDVRDALRELHRRGPVGRDLRRGGREPRQRVRDGARGRRHPRRRDPAAAGLGGVRRAPVRDARAPARRRWWSSTSSTPWSSARRSAARSTGWRARSANSTA